MENFKRREFIKLSALGFASIALQLNAMTSYAQKANAFQGRWNNNNKLNWDAFLQQLSKLAKRQYSPNWNQENYVLQVKNLLTQCNFPEFENIKPLFENYKNERENWFESETLHKEVNFQVSLFQFEKGEYIPHHDHPDMTGVINVVSGNLLAKNYNLEKQLPGSRQKVYENGHKATLKKCIIREVENEILKAGDVSVLTANEGNIHSIMPREFSQVVDVFTPAYTDKTNAKWFTVDEKQSYNGDSKLMEAEYHI